MKRISIGLPCVAACLFALTATAAPVPVAPPVQRGPITDALRLRGVLPTTAPLRASPAVMVGDVNIELDATKMVYVTKIVRDTVQLPDGKTAQVERPITEAVATTVKVHVAAKACKFFTVSKEGKLEALEPAKAMEMLKKRMPVLTGESAEVDARTLEVVKPGTLCVIQSTPTPTLPPPEIPDRRP